MDELKAKEKMSTLVFQGSSYSVGGGMKGQKAIKEKSKHTAPRLNSNNRIYGYIVHQAW